MKRMIIVMIVLIGLLGCTTTTVKYKWANQVFEVNFDTEKNKEDAFDLVRLYFVDNISDFRATELFIDRRLGVIVHKPIIEIGLSNVHYKIKLTTKDKKINIKIYDFSYVRYNDIAVREPYFMAMMAGIVNYINENNL